MSHSKVTATLATIASVSLFAACSSSPPPRARMASTEASVRAARDLGAEEVPNAEIELRRADDQIARARTLSRHGKNDDAARMLQRASIDAELATAYTHEHEARMRARQAWDQAGVPTPPVEQYQSPGPLYEAPKGK
jgi:Domain of unknown function (DUF4398)